MMYHRFLIGSLRSEDVAEVHLIRAEPRDWACLARIESGIQSLRETRRDIPPYMLVHDRAWQEATCQPEKLIRTARKFSYDSVDEFVDLHLRQTFHEHALAVLSQAWNPGGNIIVRAARVAKTATRERAPRVKKCNARDLASA
ncbi:hypothetical protein [Cupriavidus plantarum]|uniref:Uncharacterized protein n=1 Tax=Cupriavidus plantarum TaxID=942865 RepID=A0A316EZG5_9BURK|nr:hypothetical protein [Cupriavidus plantarum]NYH98888.1 hypothetical protein [Cupriavidus plantarum]PWK37442.1 hypothetical protein C7419_1011324 [Cupriavidus plantarum]REF01813.1 hypothetical protein C7418_0598 [Cupriavidus plantarum]RLK45327.1 hypothetical protein C7417_1342 [Cupriavidus plantarum]CAG2128335.1 hypothetical protein LMG26296_01370 [Cupriavidus plantarum]